jgi:hypothetical protein
MHLWSDGTRNVKLKSIDTVEKTQMISAVFELLISAVFELLRWTSEILHGNIPWILRTEIILRMLIWNWYNRLRWFRGNSYLNLLTSGG